MRVCMLLALALFWPLHAWSQEPQAPLGLELGTTFWSSIKETYKGRDGAALFEFDTKAAPVGAALTLNLSESWKLAGQFAYSRLYGIGSQPAWAFSPNHLGSMIETEGSLGYLPFPGLAIRGGVTHTYLDRRLTIFPANREISSQSSLTSPFAGVSLSLADLDGWIVRANADLLFLTLAQDAAFGDGSALTAGFTGYKFGAQIGYMFTENFGAAGVVAGKTIETEEDAQESSRRRTQWNSYGLNLVFRF